MTSRLDQLLAFFAADPSDAFTRFALAEEYRKLGRLDDALATFRALATDQPEYVGTWYHLGKLLEAMGRADEAADAYRSGAEIARRERDFHALSELQEALRTLEGDDD